MGSLISIDSNAAGKSAKVAVAKKLLNTEDKQKIIEIALKQIAQPDLLSEAQKEEMILNYRMKARKLARSILRKWHARLDLQEVDSVVDLSLCEAVKRFNPNMGASFMTFMFYHLRGNLIRSVTSAAEAALIPLADFETVLGRNEGSDYDYNKGEKAANAIEVAEALCGNEYPMQDEIVLKKELIEISQKACGKLDDLAKEVISRIYLQGQQLIDIANTLGYSRCHISRVKRRALESLYNDMSQVIGASDMPKPNFDEEEAPLKKRRASKKIFRRRPRSAKNMVARIKAKAA